MATLVDTLERKWQASRQPPFDSIEINTTKVKQPEGCDPCNYHENRRADADFYLACHAAMPAIVAALRALAQAQKGAADAVP